MVLLATKDSALALLEAERQEDTGLMICAMCRLQESDKHDSIVAESSVAVVVLNGYAATEGHLLVIPKRHVEDVTALDWNEYSELSRLVWEASHALEATLHPARIYTATLGSKAALPMSFPHHHIHVVPVYAADERARPAHVFSWSSGVTRYEVGEAQALAQRLRAAWRGLVKAPAQTTSPRMAMNCDHINIQVQAGKRSRNEPPPRHTRVALSCESSTDIAPAPVLA